MYTRPLTDDIKPERRPAYPSWPGWGADNPEALAPWGPGPRCICPDGDGAEHLEGCPERNDDDQAEPTVRAVTLDGTTIDTGRTETQLNGWSSEHTPSGWRPSQGALFDVGPAPANPNQGTLL